MQGNTNIGRVYDLICDTPSTSQQIADKLKISLEEVKSAIRGLKINGLVYPAVTISINGPRSIWCEIGEAVPQERIDEVRQELEREFPTTAGGMKADIYAYLVKAGPKMVFEIVEALGENQDSVRKAINRMYNNGDIKRVGQGKTTGGLPSYRYEAAPGGLRGAVHIQILPVEHQKVLTIRERGRRITLADKTIRAMRAAFVPGKFDPFFPLRCQLAT